MCLHFLCFFFCAASCVINDDDDDDMFSQEIQIVKFYL